MILFEIFQIKGNLYRVYKKNNTQRGSKISILIFTQFAPLTNFRKAKMER